jgi:RimJ/RimL family protein N-acetyltransferase
MKPGRGNGIASRALRLLGAYLQSSTAIRQMVLRMACENSASVLVAEKSGFQLGEGVEMAVE